MSEPFNFGDIIPITAKFVDIDDDGITNATGRVFIHRKSDGKYWNGSIFQTTRISLEMNELDEVNRAGYWNFDFDTVVGLIEDRYYFEVTDTSGNAIEGEGLDDARVGGLLTPITNLILRVLGLLHENAIVSPSYDASGNMISAIVRQYNSKAEADAAISGDPLIGVKTTWTIASPHTGLLADSFKLVIEP